MEFGPNIVPMNNVIYKTKYSYVFTNLRPLCEGHILVASIRNVPHFNDLTMDEAIDFIKLVEFSGQTMKKYLKTEALGLTIQDGPEAGQSVPHVHCHIVPHNRPPVYERMFPDDAEREKTTNKYKEFFNEELKRRKI